MRAILHVDMDAFFASVEQRDRPELRGRPVLVGGAPPRGVIAAASYEARPAGARSAMSTVEALRRCPEAVLLPPRHARYTEVSREVFAIFERYTPVIERLSIDEAFLDVTASRSLFGEGETIARRIQRELRDELGLAASAGVAASKFVAKIASDLRKPGGLVVVPEEETRTFLAPLPIERMWGVGPRAAERLRSAGLTHIGDLAEAPLERLQHLLGSWGRTVHALARGEDSRPVVRGAPAKSIGAEETFEFDLRSKADLLRELLAQSDRVAGRLLSAGLSGQLVVVKVKFRDFSLRSRQRRLEAPVADTDSIYEAARALLDGFPGLERGVRLTGVSVGELSAGPPPPRLFPDPGRERRTRLEQVVGDLRSRFGSGGVVRATLLGGRGASDPD